MVTYISFPKTLIGSILVLKWQVVVQEETTLRWVPCQRQYQGERESWYNKDTCLHLWLLLVMQSNVIERN